MSNEQGYTHGQTKAYKKLVAHPEIVKLITHEAIDTERTMAEVTHVIFCAYFNRDPGDPTKAANPVKLKAAS